MLILYAASRLPVSLGSSRRRKLNQKRVEYADRWLNGWIDGDYIEQEMKAVLCCWLNRSPLYISRGKKDESEERKTGLEKIQSSL